jgi:hypothetical protein
LAHGVFGNDLILFELGMPVALPLIKTGGTSHGVNMSVFSINTRFDLRTAGRRR